MTNDVLAESTYPISLVEERSRAGESLWFAEVEDLPGCMSQGATPEEAVESVKGAIEAWISAARENGETVPEPRRVQEHSGRFLIRAPRSLHSRLVREAQREGTSLNQFVTNALSAAVGWRTRADESQTASREAGREARGKRVVFEIGDEDLLSALDAVGETPEKPAIVFAPQQTQSSS
jgi:antitoxin HicB